jgi:hypothetical protein
MDLETIRSALRKPGKTRKGLADALRRRPSAVTALLKGERQLKASEIPIVEKYLELEPSTSKGRRSVPLVGYVGAGAEAHFYKVSQGDLDEVPAPEGATEATVAVEIRGDSLGRVFDRWLAYYDDVHRPVTAEQLGRLCVVGLENGQILVKKVRSGSRLGRFRLESERAEPIEDATVEWAAVVRHIEPQR